MAIALAAVALGWLAVGAASLYGGAQALKSKTVEVRQQQRELALMERRMAALSHSVSAMRGGADAMAARIEQRHQIIEQIIDGRLDMRNLKRFKNARMASADSPASSASGVQRAAMADAGELAGGVLARYRALEGRQLGFARHASVSALSRYKQREGLLRRMGLTTGRMVGQSQAGMGGPLVDAQSVLSRLEPQLRDFFAAWSKLDLLDRAMMSIPSFRPVKIFTYTSGFGVRYDPFTGQTAMHQGVDMSGSYGEPIYAAADGVVLRAATTGAYGTMIDIDHGRGIATRYGHLSRLLVRTGQRVTQGQQIGRMGSTGRSTGTHLHYEVRVDGVAVNPMPFLEASADVLEIQNRVREQLGAADRG